MLAAAVVVLSAQSIPSMADPAGHTVTGRFVLPDGSPLSGSVSTSDSGQRLSDGAFAVDLGSGEHLSARVDQGVFGTYVSLDLLVPSADTGDVALGDLTVPAFDPFDALVNAPDGSPIRAANVTVSLDLATHPSHLNLGTVATIQRASFSSWVTTGADGRAHVFRPSGADRPSVSVGVKLANGNAWSQTIPADVPIQDGLLDYTLPTSPRLTGTLTDTNGDPLPGWIARVGGSEGTGGSTGAFTLPMTAGGDRLAISSPLTPGVSHQLIFHLYGDPMPVDADRDLGQVRVPLPEPVTVQVVDAHGKPLAGAWLGGPQIDLLDPDVHWDGADAELAPGVGLSRANWSQSVRADADGRITVRIPRTVDGGLIDVPVGWGNDWYSGHGSTAHAEALPDGSFRVALPDLTLPPLPGAPLNVHAEPGDGAVRLTWNRPSGVADAIRYVVTSTVDGSTSTTWDEFLVLPATNGVQQSWTVQASTFMGGGAIATSNPVVPNALQLTITGTPDGAVLLGDRVSYQIAAPVPLVNVSCDADDAAARARYDQCNSSGVRLQLYSEPGPHTIDISASDVNGKWTSAQRTYVVPASITFHASFDEYWRVKRDGRPHATARQRGASIFLPRLGSGQLSVVATTGRGQGIIVTRVAGKVRDRIDLSQLPAAQRTVITLPRTSPTAKVQIQVVSRGKPVTIWATATTR